MPLLTTGWQCVATDRQPFLALGLTTPDWLNRALPTLLAFDLQRGIDGNALVHLDVRSDNCCFQGTRTLLIDYNWLATGHADLDLVCAAPSMHLEGAQEARALALRHLPSLIAVAGYFSASAGLPKPDGARSDLRDKQFACCRIALQWLAEALNLAQPDGPAARLE